jgi:hypothetical protein
LVVRSFGRKLHRTPWCAQYFVECEHVLFVHPENQTYLAEVIEAWKSDWPEVGWQRMLCVAYIRFALLFRKRAYLLLRCARAFTRLFLPTQYFPSSHSFESSGLPDQEYQQVLRTLANAEVRPPQ